MNKVLFPVLFAGCLLAGACSNDEPPIPDNAITVNMTNDNSQTTIGSSDVYINSTNNFTSRNCGIVKLGSKAGLNQNPNLNQVAQEVAVIPGYYYQIIPVQYIREIAGERAYPIDASYYNAYVDSWIYNSDNSITGATVSYVECFPTAKNLPEWDAEIEVNLRSDNYYESATFSFAKGVRIDDTYFCTDMYDTGLADHLEIGIKDNKISFRNPAYCPGGIAAVTVLVRSESIYSRVQLIVNTPD